MLNFWLKLVLTNNSLNVLTDDMGVVVITGNGGGGYPERFGRGKPLATGL